MKFVITESRINKFIYDKLDDISKFYEIDEFGEIIVFESPEDMSGLFLYEKGQLAISPEVLHYLSFFHGVEQVDNLSVIKEWFENKFKVKVKEMYPWDW